MSKSFLASVFGVGLLVLGLALLLLQVPVPTVAAQTEEAQVTLPTLNISQVVEGKASWYGPGFHGRPTSSGDIYNRYALTAAHRTLRPGTMVRVTNLRNHRSTFLLINDWGPVPEDRVIDVSEAAADVLGFREQGVVRVRIEVYRAASSPL